MSIFSWNHDYKDSPVNPSEWKLLDHHQIGSYLIVLLKYPNCTNFEGKKILVYENCTLDELIKQKDIDPHFSNSTTKFSPIARFKPNNEGLKNAARFAMMLEDA